MPSQTDEQRQNWQTSKARSAWAESLLRRAQTQISIESDAVAKIQTAINAAQTEVAAILVDIQANQAPEWRVRRAQQQVAALERLDGELRSKLLNIARAAAEEVKTLAKTMPAQETERINREVNKAVSKLTRSRTSARPEIGRSAAQDRGLVAIDARSVDIAVSFVPELIADQVGTLKKAVQAEIVRNSLALTTPAESIARLTSVATPIGAFPTAAVRAEAIVRTEFGRVSNIAAMSGIQALAANPYGLSREQRSYMLDANGVMYKEWIAVGDHRTRPEHAALDGTIIPINESFMVGEYTAQFPKDPSLPAKHAVNCRCMVVPSFPPDVADRLGAMPDDGSFGDMLAMMQEGGMVGTASAGGGEAYSYAPEVPPNGFDYDIGYDPSDAMLDTFFVNQDSTTPALSGSPDATAPQQPLTVNRGVTPISILSGIQQLFNLTGTVASRSQPSSLLSFVRFASKILNTAQRRELLKPIPSAATHEPRLSVDAADFQVWLADQRGEGKRKKPLKNKKKVLIDPDKKIIAELPTPLIIATDESISKLSPDELAEFVGTSQEQREFQRDFWVAMLQKDDGGFGVEPNYKLAIPWRGSKIIFDPKKWKALPTTVRQSIVRAILMDEAKGIGATTSQIVSTMIRELGEVVRLRGEQLTAKAEWDLNTMLLKEMLEFINLEAATLGIGRTPLDQTITIPIGTPDQGQGFKYSSDNPIHNYLKGTRFEVIGKYIPLQDLTLRVADLHKAVVFKIRVPSDPAERAEFFEDMKAVGYIKMSTVDVAEGTLTLFASGFDFLMNDLTQRVKLAISSRRESQAVPADLFQLPAAGEIHSRTEVFASDVWYTNEQGELVFDLSKYIGNEQARAFILQHNAETGKSIVDAGLFREIEELEDGSGRKIFQMHDLVDPPSPQLQIPTDGKIVGVENIFNFLHNTTGVYDASLLNTHYAIGGWRLSRDNYNVPLLVLPPAINSREIAVPFFQHLEKVLAYRAKLTIGKADTKFLQFAERYGEYEPDKNTELALISELIKNGRVAVPAAEGFDVVAAYDTPPLSLPAAQQVLAELIAIANKKRRGEELTEEERDRYVTVSNRLSKEYDALQEVLDWAIGNNDRDNTERNTIELAALHKKLTALGLDLNEDFALWRAEKLKGTAFGELAETLIAANPKVPRQTILRRIFGIRGLSGSGIGSADGYTRIDPFDESNGTDAFDLMQFAEERGFTPEQILGEARVSVLRQLYEADLLKVVISRSANENGLRDGLGRNLPLITLDDSGVVRPRPTKLIVPAALGENGVTLEQLKTIDVIDVPATYSVYDKNAPMAERNILDGVTLPFRGVRETTLSGDEGFRFFLRSAVGNQLLGLANAGLFKSLNYKMASYRSSTVRNQSGDLSTSFDKIGAEAPQVGIFTLARNAKEATQKSALAVADAIARDALHDPLQFEDVLRAVARAAVERGASPDDPLIAAFLAIPRLQDGSEIVRSTFWDEPNSYRSARLRMKRNPDLDLNPHYDRLLSALAGSSYTLSPLDGVDMSALTQSLFEFPPEPDPSAPQDVRNKYYDERQKIVEKRANFARALYKDPMFILRAILSRAYTKDQQRELMGTVAPFEGQMLANDAAWVLKPVDIAWYELEATLLEIFADEAAKRMPAGRSDGTLFSQDAYSTVKMTPEILEALKVLDAHSDLSTPTPESEAAQKILENAAQEHAEQRAALIAARIAPVVEALGFARGTKEYDNMIQVYVTHAMIAIPPSSLIGEGTGRNLTQYLPAILAAGDGSLAVFGRRGLSTIPAEGAGMAMRVPWRALPKLQVPDGKYRTASPLTPQKLRLIAKGMRDHLVNAQLERQSLLRPQIVNALNENNALLLGGKIKAAEWAAKARALIRAKREAIRKEQERLRILAKSKPAVQVTDALYEKTLEKLDSDLAAALKSIPKNKFLEVTDSAVQQELEQYRKRIDDLMEGVEKTIMGNTFIELGAPDTAKSLGSRSINKPWKGKWQGHPFIIKSTETMYDQTIREEYGDFRQSDLWAEPAAQIIDELGGLFIRKAQAYIRELPDIKGVGGDILDESKALLMDWLTGYPDGHSAQRGGSQSAAQNFDLMGLFDALIGNLDRHGGNYLVAPIPTATQPAFDDDGYPIDPVTLQKTGEKWEQFKIVPIDNGLAFPDPDVHLDNGGMANLSPFMSYQRGTPLTTRSREVLLRLWANRSELYLRLTTVMGASRTRGFFYRMIWMLRSNELMDRRTFDSAAYNPQSRNADEVIRGAFADGQSLLDALVAPVASGTSVRQDPNRVEGQIPALPLSDEP